MPLVVVTNWYGRPGGEVFEWGESRQAMLDAIDAGRVVLFDRTRCPRPFFCGACGRRFITRRSLDAHESAGCSPT